METIATILNLEIRPEVTALTCSARICRSGSAMEIKKPRISPARQMIHILLVLVRLDPIKVPIEVIPRSTPNKKIDKPRTINKAPSRNLIRKVVSRGVTVKCRTKTIKVMGRTANKTSLNLSTSTFKLSDHFLSVFLGRRNIFTLCWPSLNTKISMTID